MSACECRKEIETKLLKRFVESSPNATEHHVELKGYAYILAASGFVSKGCMPFEMTALFPLKKGGVKSKTEKQNMIFTYCPFCGEKYSKDNAEAA